MWCFVSLPDSTVSEFDLPERARGQELLDAVCKRLGIIEVDYFGLQYAGTKGETLWLNTRNRINRQVSGGPPLRLQFRVKFFVQPHLLLQEASRHQHFLHLRKDFEGRKVVTNPVKSARMYALLAQATIGDHCNSHFVCKFCQNTENNSFEWTSDLRTNITQEHEKLNGVKPSTAEYHFLKEIAELEDFGIEFHTARNNIGQQLHIGVGSEELRIFDTEFNFIERISYNVLKMATHIAKSLFLTIMTTDGEDNVVEFKLITQGAACGLYRSITEYHAFYRCETVRNSVKSQFTRDFRETFFSLFNEEESDKKYIFDVKRTCKEVYDYYRRVLYNQGCDPINGVTNNVREAEPPTHDLNASSDYSLQEKLSKLEDGLRCKVCMDEQINAVLIPCGHMVCCEQCAMNLEACPVCRGAIDHVQKAFLPVAIQ